MATILRSKSLLVDIFSAYDVSSSLPEYHLEYSPATLLHAEPANNLAILDINLISHPFVDSRPDALNAAPASAAPAEEENPSPFTSPNLILFSDVIFTLSLIFANNLTLSIIVKARSRTVPCCISSLIISSSVSKFPNSTVVFVNNESRHTEILS